MARLSVYPKFLPAFLAATILLFLTAVSGIGSPVLAQSSTPTAPSTSAPGEAQQPAEQSNETVKVSVNVVGVFFNVKDKHGALIPNQTKDDFEVFEDGKPQTIKYFAAESNLPLTLAS
jgi:hypothetical protein